MNQITHLAQAPKTYNFESDSAGDWNIVIDNELSAGAHIVSVEDEHGNMDQAIMYVIKDKSELQSIKTEPIFIEKITTVVPDNFAWPLVMLAGVIAFLSVFLILIAGKASLREKKLGVSSIIGGEKPKTAHYLRYAIIVCLFALAATALVGIFFSRETNFLSRFFGEKPKITVVEELQGQVLHPLEKMGVSGLDLAYGNTSIRTSGSGHYIFNNIGINEGIRATHPELLRPLVFLPEAKQNKELMNILFDSALFNNLIRVLDIEARGRYADIYWNYTSPKVRAMIAENGYVSDYPSTKVKPENVNDQELIVKKVEVIDKFNLNKYGLSFDKAVLITVIINDNVLVYPWEYENGTWYLLN